MFLCIQIRKTRVRKEQSQEQATADNVKSHENSHPTSRKKKERKKEAWTYTQEAHRQRDMDPKTDKERERENRERAGSSPDISPIVSTADSSPTRSTPFRCHWKWGSGLPEASTDNEAESPGRTMAALGCLVITGTVDDRDTPASFDEADPIWLVTIQAYVPATSSVRFTMVKELLVALGTGFPSRCHWYVGSGHAAAGKHGNQ